VRAPANVGYSFEEFLLAKEELKIISYRIGDAKLILQVFERLKPLEISIDFLEDSSVCFLIIHHIRLSHSEI